MNRLLEIIKDESTMIAKKNRMRLIFVYNYAIKNKLITPTEDGAIYIAENQIESVFLRLKIDSPMNSEFEGEIKEYSFITRFNHKRILQKELKVDDTYKEMRKTKSGYLSYKRYMSLNGVFENMSSWHKYIKTCEENNANNSR